MSNYSHKEWQKFINIQQGQKKVVLFPEIGWVICHSPAHILECVSECIFLILKNKQAKKKKKKEKKICDRPGEDSSCHPHF